MFGKIGSAMKGFGERVGNFGLTDAARQQMGADAFKSYRNDQLWNMGAALQGYDGGRDPSRWLQGMGQGQPAAPANPAAAPLPDMNMAPFPAPQQRQMGFGLNFGRGRGMRGGGLLDMGGR